MSMRYIPLPFMTRAAASLTLLLLLAGTAIAAEIPVVGYVRDLSGNPVAGARVTLVNEGSESQGASDVTLTSEEGLFHFVNKPEGIYAVSVSAERYLPYQDSFQMTFSTRRLLNITLNKSDQFEPETIYVGKGLGKITGTVIDDASDEPVADAVVSVGDRFVQTNDAGSFGFESLGTGSRVLKVQKSGYEKIEKEVTLAPRSHNVVVRLSKIVKYSTVLGRVKVKDRRDHDCPPIRVYMGGKTAVTDYKGSFRFENVREGSYPILLIYNKKEIHNDTIKVSRGVSAYEILIDSL